MPARFVLESIRAGSVAGDLLLIYGYTDSEGSGITVTRLDPVTLQRRWLRPMGIFNVSQTIDGDDLFLAGVGFVSRIDLKSGRFVWQLRGLYGRGDFSFTSFLAPAVAGEEVVFTEQQLGGGLRADKRIIVNRETGKARLDRVVADNGHDSDDATFNHILGVDCTHCHVAGDWKSDGNPKLAVARRMRQMVDRINSTSLNGIGKITCWTCHEGQTKPRRLPSESWMAERDKAFTGALMSQPDDVKIRMSVYAASLSVKCEFCHVPGDWLNASKSAFQVAGTMNAMFEVFPEYMPPTARTQCFMCHKGRTSPRTGLLSSGHDEARPRT
jgi:hypothetical protein